VRDKRCCRSTVVKLRDAVCSQDRRAIAKPEGDIAAWACRKKSRGKVDPLRVRGQRLMEKDRKANTYPNANTPRAHVLLIKSTIAQTTSFATGT
jgi:hypothetical protein